MSLCCLIYKNNKVINSCDDLVQIWILEIKYIQYCLNQLDNPFNVDRITINFKCVLSLNMILNIVKAIQALYMHQEAAIEGYQYCISLQKAFESLNNV